MFDSLSKSRNQYIGKVFGELVVNEVIRSKSGHSFVAECVCNHGNTISVPLKRLLSGTNIGCYCKEEEDNIMENIVQEPDQIVPEYKYDSVVNPPSFNNPVINDTKVEELISVSSKVEPVKKHKIMRVNTKRRRLAVKIASDRIGELFGSNKLISIYGFNKGDSRLRVNIKCTICDGDERTVSFHNLCRGELKICRSCSNNNRNIITIDKYRELIGMRFGNLVISGIEHIRRNGDKLNFIYANYVCDCGAENTTRLSNIINNGAKSCKGCSKRLSIEENRKAKTVKKSKPKEVKPALPSIEKPIKNEDIKDVEVKLSPIGGYTVAKLNGIPVEHKEENKSPWQKFVDFVRGIFNA